MPRAGGSSVSIPTLTVFLPQPGKTNGTAVVVAPGGAYLGLAVNLEGRQVADWFTELGVTASVLTYRLCDQNLYPIRLMDAQRAIRLVRSLDKRYGFRHSLATNLPAAGVDLKTAQELLRHANSRITLEVYTRAISATKREANDRVMQMMLEAGTKQLSAPSPAPSGSTRGRCGVEIQSRTGGAV